MSSGGDATIWAADFSLSGRYLAVAGKDRSIKVFKVIATEEERSAQQRYESQSSLASKSLLAPVFLSQPCREFKGHSAEILTLSWIAFHPTDDRFFLSGSFDATLRLWDITRISIVYSALMTDIITAVAFSPDGKVAICGSFNGTCIFLDTAGLRERSRICIQSSGSKSGVCPKITGLQTIISSDSIDTTGQAKLMMTTNDSRIRIYYLVDYGLEYKLEGIRNQSSQIHARFNDSGEYAICGSENDEVHIWHLNSGEPKEFHERFHTHSEAVTNATMAPMVTRKIEPCSKYAVHGRNDPRFFP
ncbi:hypothetical protein FLAG1_10839 [Fusarium langsethiae]|uniref:Uncharacterized protein n=1 Tax=Fusarium langsethiae TaxID=179993 RepID=A0A0M9EMZ7_FUSLA|nr:hypothetical protein FLAG1_10839 [Fusarium langsethiae]